MIVLPTGIAIAWAFPKRGVPQNGLFFRGNSICKRLYTHDLEI